MVLGDEATADAAAAEGRQPAWIQGMSIRSEPAMAAGRDQVNPQAGRDCVADVYAQAGITNPIEEIDAVECYVPFSWYEPMWMENLGFAEVGEGWKLTESGATGMIRFGEAAMQVRGQAGDHQVHGVRRALGHAYGGATQFYAMWVVGTGKP